MCAHIISGALVLIRNQTNNCSCGSIVTTGLSSSYKEDRKG